MTLKTNLGKLRILALLEGISAILLTIVTVSKYAFKFYNESVNYSIGLSHGFLFVSYVIFVLIVGKQKKWNLITMGWSLFASIIPVGTFIADAKIFAKA